MPAIYSPWYRLQTIPAIASNMWIFVMLLTVASLFHEHQPDAVMHLAAESHVDRSITARPLYWNQYYWHLHSPERSTEYWSELSAERKNTFRFHHISTDEVYGSLGETGFFTENTAYQPNSPYSASKASSDHLVRAWYHTYGLPVVTTNCSNNYGLIISGEANPVDHPECVAMVSRFPFMERATTSATGCM